MLTYRFDTENDIWATVNALRVAAERFDENAKMFRKDVKPVQEGVARQFDDQAKQARRIATEIESLT